MCLTSEGKPFISLSGERCSKTIAMHEMLHVWRYFIQRIRMFNVHPHVEDAKRRFVNDIENAYEHTIIITHQASLGDAEIIPRFEKRTLERYSRIPGGKVNKWQMVMMALDTTSWGSSQQFKTEMEKFLPDKYREKCIYWGACSEIEARMGASNDHKKRVLQSLLPQFGYKPDEVCLFDIVEQRWFPVVP